MSNILVQRLAVMFGRPESDDPTAYLEELAKLTRTYSVQVLGKAADMLIRSHQPTMRKPWPSPSDICVACADAAEVMNPPKVPTNKVIWTKESVRKADMLIQSDVGRQAADEGWMLPLWHFCQEKGRLPHQGTETANLVHRQREFMLAYQQCVDGGWPNAKPLRDLGDTMIRRGNRKADLAHGIIDDA